MSILSKTLREKGNKCLERWRAIRQEYTGLPVDLPEGPLGALLAPMMFVDELSTAPSSDLPLRSYLIHAAACWRQTGGPTYELTQSSAAALLLTDAAKIPSHDVVWPYNAFLISLPSPSPLTFSKCEDGVEEDVSDVFVFKRRWLMQRERRKEYTNNFGASFHHMRETGVFSAPTVDDKHLEDSLIIFIVGKETADTIGTVWSDARLDKLFAEVKELPQIQGTSTRYAPVGVVLRLVVNLLLYLASREKHKIPTLGKRRHQGQQQIFTVPLQDPDTGRVIKLSPELRAAARTWANKATQPTRYKLATRIAVPGHYRHYYIGPRTANPKEKVRKWILPYMYGDDAAISMMKTYRIDEVPK